MKKFFADFKQFIMRGNVVDMAVGVIVGGAFTKIVNSNNENIISIMPQTQYNQTFYQNLRFLPQCFRVGYQ